MVEKNVSGQVRALTGHGDVVGFIMIPLTWLRELEELNS